MPPLDYSANQPYQLETDRPRHGVIVARVGGELDYAGTPRLRTLLLDHVDRAAGVLVVDLTGVRLLSAAAMEMLLAVDVHAAARGCQLRVVAATRAVLRPLALTGLDGRLRIFASADEAVAAPAR